MVKVQDDENYTETAEFSTYMNALHSILVEIYQNYDLEEKSNDEIRSIFEARYDQYLTLEEYGDCTALIAPYEVTDPPSVNRPDCDAAFLLCLAAGGSEDFCSIVRAGCEAYNPNGTSLE